MRYVVAADAWFQKHFDGAVHWIMWTCGVSKGFVRHALWATILIGYALRFVMNVQTGDVDLSTLDALSISLFGYFMWRDKRLDDVADADGSWSASDAVSHTAGMFLKSLWATFVAVDAVAIVNSSGMHRHASAAMIIVHLAFLAHSYLIATPPFPPERREKKLVMATENA